MAYELNLQPISMVAGQDLSTKQYYFVSMAADGQIDPTGDGASADGVLQNNPDAIGKTATVAIGGISKVVAGAAIAAGADVASGAAGKAKTATTGNRVLGKAMTAASADGDIISVLLKVQGAPNAA